MKIGSTDITAAYIGNTAINKVYLGSTEIWTSFTGLLDLYPGAAAAYSLRRLSEAYNGPAIEVRNDAGQLLDIGFTDEGQLDTAALLAHCGSGDGFVKTWYDQSGNGYDASQSTAASQPQIVSGGSVILRGGKPSVYGDGNNDSLQYSDSAFPTGDITFDLFHVEELISTGQAAGSASISGTPYINDRRAISSLCNEGSRNAVRLFGGNTIYNENEIGYRLTNINYQGGGGAINARVDAQDLTVLSFSNIRLSMVSSTDLILFGIKQDQINSLESYISEFVLYLSDQSSNRTGIETNINDFYSIY